MGGACSTHGSDEKRIQNSRRKTSREKTRVNRKVISKWILKKEDMKMWSGFIWLRIGTGGGLFWTR
jgi:hypothetical protein